MPVNEDVQSALAWLKENSTPPDYANLARFGITAGKAFGVSMANIQKLGNLNANKVLWYLNGTDLSRNSR